MANSKKYGLIVPEKAKTPVFRATRNVFGDDSDSDEASNKKPVLLRPSENINRQAKIAQNKAIVEDPTVFQYDEVYDIMKNEKEVQKDKKKEEKKPRYIENLMKSANKRKIENERRIERQIQKERENEGDEFADKEVFVTSAYKKKLEEMSLEEEREKREEYLESIGDVTKQRDLGGFYRHLYEQKLGSEKEATNVQDTTKVDLIEKGNANENCTKNIILRSSDKDTTELSKKRNYRKRKTSSETSKQVSEDEVEDSKKEINRMNLDDIRLAKKQKPNKENIDADSDFSIDDSSDEDNKDIEKSAEIIFKKPEEKGVIEKEAKKSEEIENKSIEVKVVTENKPKIDIWKKRTVGEVFQQALKRYYERKASRGLM